MSSFPNDRGRHQYGGNSPSGILNISGFTFFKYHHYNSFNVTYIILMVNDLDELRINQIILALYIFCMHNYSIK